jgi:hypothetical protein
MWRRGTFALAALAVVAGCASAVDGNGHRAVPSTGGGTLTIAPPSVPSSSASRSTPPPNPLACPHVSYAAGRLAFACLTGAMRLTRGDEVWALTLSQEVEPQKWVLAEGAQKLAPLRGRTLKQVALSLRASMLSHTQYGDEPTVRTASAKSATVAGVPAYILQTDFTINPQYRAEYGLMVRVEKLWIVTLNAGDGQVASWYVTVPDDVSNLWAKVPALIRSIGLI